MRRIQFFSIHDGASGHYLRKIESLLSNIDIDHEFQIDDLLELYNAKLYLDNGMFLKSWDEDKQGELKKKAESCWKLIKSFFLKIDSEAIVPVFEQVAFQYHSNFWNIISQLEIYKKTSDDAVNSLLDKHPKEINNILQEERIVKRFSTLVRDFLVTHADTAELILANEGHSERKHKFYFPKSLSNDDKEKIINDYLDSENPNLNYVTLVEYAKNTLELKLSDRTKLKAKRVYNNISDKLLQSDLTSTRVYGVEVIVDEDQKQPVTYQNKDNTFTAIYSSDHLRNAIETENLLSLFRDLYHFTNEQGLITLVSKESELDTMERIFMRSKNEYLTGEVFRRKNMLSLLQILLTNRVLAQQSKNIANLLPRYFETICAYNSALKNFRFHFPSDSLSDTEKIRIIGPELESLLKQYQLYMVDGEIDFELLEISSSPISFSQINSIVKNKYVYANHSSKIGELLFHFFSDQSFLHYVEPYKEKYHNFYSLLKNEGALPLENFETYQRRVIDKLILDNHLFIDDNNNLKIKNDTRFFLISKLHKNEVISYWHFPSAFRNEMNEMIQEGLCYAENTLFTKNEISYFNYYLNKKEFTDGPDLRNKYMHGTNQTSGKDNNQDYLMYLRIVIVCLLKIEDDLMLYQESIN